MDPEFQPLVARVESLGKPARKHLRTLERHGELLLGRLESEGSLCHVHLDRAAPAVAEDFARVAAAGRSAEETLVLLGTFFALQTLHQNARSLEELAVELAERRDRFAAFATFLERTEEEFSRLVSTYVRHVLDLVALPEAGPFVILNVGTPGHQDDVDTAVIHDGRGDVAAIDRTVARLAGQCLRYASPLDNYVAGQVDVDGFAIGLGELRDALGSGRLDFLVVTELLRAEPLAGDPAVLERLRREVMAEYLYRPGHDNTRHELYLRGLLGETRSLLLRPPPPDLVAPKDDGLRLILGLATAFKTMEALDATQPGSILAELEERRPERRAELARLGSSRIFLEAFRQVAQMLVAEEEEIAVEGPAARDNLRHLAAALGCQDWGPVRASDRVLVHYHEAVEQAHAAALPLMDDVARHLRAISSFARWTRGTPPPDLAQGLAEGLATAGHAFRDVRFYDDVLDAFSAADGERLDAFARSYASLAPDERSRVAEVYAQWGLGAPYSFLTILTLLAARPRRRGTVSPVDEITGVFFSRLAPQRASDAVRALSRVFRFYPDLMNRFLLALKPPCLASLETAAGVSIANPEVAAAREGFLELIRLHRRSSRFFKRVLARVTQSHPATVQAISDDAGLRTLALGRLAASERHPSADRQKALLGDFYDLEFLRLGVGTLRGTPVGRIRSRFTELTDTYLERLFDFCFRQVREETGGWTAERQRVGVFLTGGNARGRPFDEDYDMLVLLDSDDEAARIFVERVVVVLNAQIARRGLVTQYRLGEWLGRFVIRFDELVDLLEREEDELFVDRCQILGCRTVVGGRRLEQRLLDQVIGPCVFHRADALVERVAREILQHRESRGPRRAGTLHLKEDPGGLRDIDLALVIARSRLRLWDGSETSPFASLARGDPRRANLYRELEEIDDLLVGVRSAYRIAVAATDEIEPELLATPARLLGYRDRDDPVAGARLFAHLERRLERAAALVDELAGLAVRA